MTVEPNYALVYTQEGNDMGCGCRKKSSTNTRAAVEAGSRVVYEVYLNDKSTGRHFTSLITAQQFATKIGGEVRAL
jgi:hypothetical protein